jgi:hypothetical protein
MREMQIAVWEDMGLQAAGPVPQGLCKHRRDGVVEQVPS